jgi:NADH-quinone oxidoreductase subunit G
MTSATMFAAIGFYAGLTLDAIGGRGVRWPARAQAAAWPQADTGPFGLEAPPYAPTPNGALRLGTFRSIWAAAQVERSPSLKFLRAHQRAELSPIDARRIGVAHGDRVTISSAPTAGFGGAAARGGGTLVSTSIQAIATLRAAVPEGTVFLESGLGEDSASELDASLVEIVPA